MTAKVGTVMSKPHWEFYEALRPEMVAVGTVSYATATMAIL